MTNDPHDSDVVDKITFLSSYGIVVTLTSTPLVDTEGRIKVKFSGSALVVGDALFQYQLTSGGEEEVELKPKFSANTESFDVHHVLDGLIASVKAAGFIEEPQH